MCIRDRLRMRRVGGRVLGGGGRGAGWRRGAQGGPRARARTVLRCFKQAAKHLLATSHRAFERG
eukprot:8867304-Lingulodinium_polyedra.AAC.1